MPFFDLPLEQLKTYLSPLMEEADFDRFWQASLAEARQIPLQARSEPVQTGLNAQDFFDVTYPGFGGQPINGWLVLPSMRSGKLPCVVEFIGHNGGGSFQPVEKLKFLKNMWDQHNWSGNFPGALYV